MPIYDFATVDENHQEVLYNWGYDPAQYNVPEGSYCTNLMMVTAGLLSVNR
ncbi:MAG: hypothetical protein ACLRQF_19755 [Thomasclavelia ramosa]